MAAEIALGCCPQPLLSDYGSRGKGQGVLVVAYGGDLSLHDIRETIEDMLTARFQAEHGTSRWPSPSFSPFACVGEKNSARHLVSRIAEQALRHVFVINAYTPLQLLHITKWLPYFFSVHPSVRALLVDGVIKGVASALAESSAGPGQTFFAFSSRRRVPEGKRIEKRKRKADAGGDEIDTWKKSSQPRHSASPSAPSSPYSPSSPSVDTSAQAVFAPRTNSPAGTGAASSLRGPTHSMHMLTLAVQQILRLHQEERLLLVYTKQVSPASSSLSEGKEKREDRVSFPLWIPCVVARQKALGDRAVHRDEECSSCCRYTSDSALHGPHKGMQACAPGRIPEACVQRRFPGAPGSESVPEEELRMWKTEGGERRSSPHEQILSDSLSSSLSHSPQKPARTNNSTEASGATEGSTEAGHGSTAEGKCGNEGTWQNVKFSRFPQCPGGALLRIVATAATDPRPTVLRSPLLCGTRPRCQVAARSERNVGLNELRRHYRVFQFQLVRAESSVACEPMAIEGTNGQLGKRVSVEALEDKLRSPGTFLACVCSCRSVDDAGRRHCPLQPVSGPEQSAQPGTPANAAGTRGGCTRQITGVVVGGRHVVREGGIERRIGESDWERQEKSPRALRGDGHHEGTENAFEQEEREKDKQHGRVSRDISIALLQGKAQSVKETRGASNVAEKPSCATCGVFFFLTKEGHRDFVVPL
ncbi:conserved hypothetical protein [Neospora caninum Liverpool]|uniref:Uncharacterized protein n=1 Tax=Neospora caninum (strain Liverpool) TaxID=572307 RepID=F0VMG0_NEOCL|nr:conserved hypothetical protein [Neospora caninum Liverpool]CBZ54906.1 conserved hypothetical protein [Neospora caninum Liverpool]CEL69627.1 TPA: hypothetical protein BN1204_053320 [Neospora caninum Liverpool]|eukprot:XP_003884934.1 conserved hypothetical protein [Neospora caninum Liverpool]